MQNHPWEIIKERQEDAIRLSEHLSQSRNLRNWREQYIFIWSKKNIQDIMQEIQRLREKIDKNGGRGDGDMDHEVWRIAALQGILEES